MNKPYYKLDENHNPIPCKKMEVTMWEIEKRRVAKDTFETPLTKFIKFITFGRLTIKGGTVMVSTVFLIIDHNWLGGGDPVLFETMVFGGKFDQEIERYCTWEEAETGHKKWVSTVKREILPW